MNKLKILFSSFCTMVLFIIQGCSTTEKDNLEDRFITIYKEEKATVKWPQSHSDTKYCYNIQPTFTNTSSGHWFVFCVEEYSNTRKAKKAFSKITERELKAPACFLLYKNRIYQAETYCANEDAMKSIVANLLSCLNPDDIQQENMILVECGGRIVPYEK